MHNKTLEPGRISLTLHGQTYTVENLDWDIDGEELLDEFKGLMVASGFSPSIMNDEWGGWEYKEYDNGKED